MNIRLAACLFVVAALVGAVLFLVAGGDGRGADLAGATGGAPAPPRAAELAPLEVAAPPGAPASPSARENARAAVAPLESGPSGAWRGELAGLGGRVVESDGRPVAGMRVALLEFDGSQIFDGTALGQEEPSLQLEEALTDEAGRFLLGGARQQAFHGLGIDLGGPRATVRVVDQALAHGERTDLGDVVLAPFGVLSGRVLDEHGAPLAGARIRSGPFPAEILQGQPQDFRSDSLVAINLATMGAEGQEVLELPAWVAAWLERLPVPTTHSGADGTFRLEGVALAQVVGGVDARGFVGVTFGPIDLSAGTHDLGTLVLARGRTVRGVVEDAAGDPVAGAEVQAGSELVPGIVALLQPCGTSDAEGRFELSGVRETGQIVAAARRAPHEAWSVVTSTHHERVLIEMESSVRLTVRVRDEASQPLAGADLRLTPARMPDPALGFVEVFALLPRRPSPRGSFAEVEPGKYVHAGLGAGRYRISARVAGLAPGFLETECRGSENEVTLTCPAGRRVELTVLDAATRAPIAEARASVLSAAQSGFVKLAVHTTDASGRAVLGPLPEHFTPNPDSSPFASEPILLVEHPRHGDHSAQLDPHASPLVVALSAGGVLAGRVHCDGAQPTRPYMLTLEYRGADGMLELFHLPRLAVSDLAGAFRCANLAPGEYGVELSDRFLEQDPLGLMARGFAPATLHRGQVDIRDGETTELVIDLTPGGRGASARVVGHVRFDGRNLEGAKVNVSGNENVQVTTDAGGRFETPAFSVLGTSILEIEGEVSLSGGAQQRMQLHSESLELAADDVHTVDLDLYPIPLRVRVVAEATGEPVSGVEVSARIQEDENHGLDQQGPPSDAAGWVELVVLRPGAYLLTAGADGFCGATASVQVSAQGTSEPTLLRLPRAVACKGRVDASAAGTTEARFSWLWVQSDDGSNSAGTQLEAPDYAFELEGLAPGKYTAHFYLGGSRGQDLVFELGKDGAEDLVLVFTPQEDSEEEQE